MTEPSASDRLPEDEAPRRLAGQNRIRLIGICFGIAFLAIAGQLTRLTLFPGVDSGPQRVDLEDRLPRPDIIDRNGVLLATDVAVASLYADPSKIIDIDEAIELLTATVPDLDAKELRRKLTSSKRFAWLKRQVSPEERDAASIRRAGWARMWWAMSISTPRASPASRNTSTARARSTPPPSPSPPNARPSPRRCRSTSASRRR
jgi:cell division protein FtsI/penicillin-binding protein 2